MQSNKRRAMLPSVITDTSPHHNAASFQARVSTPSKPSPASFLSLFSASFLAFSSINSSRLSTRGLSSMGVPNGAMIFSTTWCTCFETRQPGWMLTISPVRRELFGSCTRTCLVRLKCWRGVSGGRGTEQMGRGREIWDGCVENRKVMLVRGIG
jgi:hypothetical protein